MQTKNLLNENNARTCTSTHLIVDINFVVIIIRSRSQLRRWRWWVAHFDLSIIDAGRRWILEVHHNIELFLKTEILLMHVENTQRKNCGSNQYAENGKYCGNQ